MQQLDMVIHNATGLHARPAKVFVTVAKQFQSKITVGNGAKQVNAKSLISVLTLGVENGQSIQIEVEGEDEIAAIQALENAVLDGLGEEIGEPHGSTVAPPPPPSVSATPPVAVIPSVNGNHSGEPNLLRGIPAAPGIAIGPIYRIRQETIVTDDSFAGIAEEKNRLNRAIGEAKTQLMSLRSHLRTHAESEAAIFDVHLELLDDSDLLDGVTREIHQKNGAARAWQGTIAERAKRIAALDDPLLAARSADLHDVGYRVLRFLVGNPTHHGVQLPDHPVVVVAHDLSPSDTASLDTTRVLGFCTAAGGPTAHSAIIARALALPAVVSAGETILTLADGTMVVLDGATGTVTISPDEATVAKAYATQQQQYEQREAAQQLAADPAITQDGHRVEIVANIGGVADAEQAAASGAEGVGLLRTEFLFLDRTEPPGETAQYEVYRDIARVFGSHPVIVRTLDIGGDKPLPYITVPPESNPFLGERGIRLCLNRPELLREQVRAILRASTEGKLRIMFPMISDVGEFRRARQIVEEVRAELGVPPVEVGIMVEVPSAALMADALAREVDFFSIGTNDLTQYTLAMDRMHPTLAAASDGLHPAVLRLIQRTVEAAHHEGKWVGVCGELGADPQAIPILVGIGVDELSVSVPAIPGVKAQIRSLTLEDAKKRASQALACTTAAEVREIGK
jgi:phosphoenolpyruvate-protein phosphotransferase